MLKGEKAGFGETALAYLMKWLQRIHRLFSQSTKYVASLHCNNRSVEEPDGKELYNIGNYLENVKIILHRPIHYMYNGS